MKAILTYHSIDDSGSPISVSPAVFQAHAQWLAGGRVRVLSLDDLVTQPATGEDAVAVTFDDGFANVKSAVAPLLDRGLPLTIFAVTGHVGKTNAWGGRSQAGIPTLPLLGWDDLGQLLRQGVAVEAHTCTHPRLTRLSAAALEAELQPCRNELHVRLGVRSQHLAYPYGDVNDRVMEHATREYRFGHTTEFRMLGPVEPPLRLPRIDMYYFRAPAALEAWGTPGFWRRLVWIRVRRLIRSRLPQWPPA